MRKFILYGKYPYIEGILLVAWETDDRDFVKLWNNIKDLFAKFTQMRIDYEDTLNTTFVYYV